MSVLFITTTDFFVLLLSLIGANGKETLHLGVLFSQEGFDNTGFIPAINIALETIKNTTTLPFSFEITRNDSKVTVRSYIIMRIHTIVAIH